VADNAGIYPKTGREKLRKILMSGGYPMVLLNKNLVQCFSALADASIDNIRIGTKELAFPPDRFDKKNFAMMDDFHAVYPVIRFRMMVYFNHPDEFLAKDEQGNYIEDPAGGLFWVEGAERAVSQLANRKWISIENQAPFIKRIINDAAEIRIMQRELKRNRIENHYFFCR
jgi:lysine 2,3-aminomutase